MIIDLRMPEEKDGTPQGAVSFPVPLPPVDIPKLRKRLREFLLNIRRSEPISVFCAKGVRSSIATSLIKDLGFYNVTNLGGYKP